MSSVVQLQVRLREACLSHVLLTLPAKPSTTTAIEIRHRPSLLIKADSAIGTVSIVPEPSAISMQAPVSIHHFLFSQSPSLALTMCSLHEIGT